MDEQQIRALMGRAGEVVRSIACTRSSTLPEAGADTPVLTSAAVCYQTTDGRFRRDDTKGTVICDGTNTWFLRADAGQVVKSSTALPAPLDDVLSPSWLDTGVVLVDSGETSVNGRPCRAVEVYQRDPAGGDAGPRGPLQYSVAVDIEYGIVLRSSEAGEGLRFELSDVRVNDELPQELFQMVPLDGVEVIDPAKDMPGPGLPQIVKAAARQFLRHRPRD